jgi:hypothetical protein
MFIFQDTNAFALRTCLLGLGVTGSGRPGAVKRP